MDVITVEAKGFESVPEWMRATLVGDDGTLYMPCGVFGNESEALLSAMYDGVSTASHLGHPFAPTDWLAKEYPLGRELIQVATKNVKSRL